MAAKKSSEKPAVKSVDKTDIKWVGIDEIRPYENNPRDNSESIPKVAESIKEFGFLQPIVCDKDGVILAGHTRYAASQSLGLKKVPVLYAADLTPEQAKAYRLADNKVSESSRWDDALLIPELQELESAFSFDMEEFGFDMTDFTRHQKSWKRTEKLCDLKKKIAVRSETDYWFTTFYATGKQGIPIADIKKDEANVPVFADNLCYYLEKTIGLCNLKKNSWCIVTTPRRRHKSGMHFSTEICRNAAKQIGIHFYEDAFIAENRDRINPKFTMEKEPKEANVILYDDIVSTGVTLKVTRQMLLDKGHTVLVIAGIRNQ